MRGLTIVVAEASAARFRTALHLALTTVALGAGARLFLDGAAVSILRQPIVGPDDERHAAAGLPTLPALVGEALDAGVRLILCQTGMALAGTKPRDHDRRIEYGGMVSLLQTLDDDRLMVI